MSRAQSYDLTANWSNAQNPAGPWTCREGNVPLAGIASWGPNGWSTPQFAWTSPWHASGSSVPCWFKSNGGETFDHAWEQGDVVVRTAGPLEGATAGFANAAWTSPLDGLITVTGGLWVGLHPNQPQRWRLFLQGVLLSTGLIQANDTSSRIAPHALLDALGQPILNQNVTQGDVLRLEAGPDPATGQGDFLGARLNVIVCIGITRQPRHAIACPGGPGRLSIEARTSYGTLTYRWRRNGVPLLEGGRYHGVFGPTLTIDGVGAADATVYDCVVGSLCSALPSAPASLAVCPADFDCSGSLEVPDLFAYINAWFAGEARADFDASGGITVRDILDFVAAWFVGC